MNKIDDLCLWKDLFYLYEIEGTVRGLSTFDDYKKWTEKHPLYKCIGCGGYDIFCSGYRSLKEIGRNRQ